MIGISGLIEGPLLKTMTPIRGGVKGIWEASWQVVRIFDVSKAMSKHIEI